MFWLTLLVLWAAASIVVAVAWGKLVRWNQGSDDEYPDAAPLPGLEASAEVPPPECPRRSPHR
jgi:hypothetical protein